MTIIFSSIDIEQSVLTLIKFEDIIKPMTPTDKSYP